MWQRSQSKSREDRETLERSSSSNNMCGILAVFGGDATSALSRDRILKLAKLLRHRGPDWYGIVSYRNAILAHERLAVVGLNSGSQPILNVNGTVALAVNGEIYNQKELKARLECQLGSKSLSLTTDSDCEILLHLYEHLGPDFLSMSDEKENVLAVNGMYAFVLYDSETGNFMVARDPVGIIPLYVGWGSDGSVWFASEMKALQEHCDLHIDIFAPGHTMVGNVLKADQHMVTKAEQRPFYTRRWFMDEQYLPSAVTMVANDLREQLTSSVRRHLMSDVPYGMLLSGGLDSSLIASIAQREYSKLGNADVLRSFCIGLPNCPDLEAASRVASFIGSRHYNFTFTVEQGLDALSDVIYHLETFEVTTIRAALPMYLLARRIKAFGLKMVLSGEGADEIFGGYLYFYKAPDKANFHSETVRKIRKLHLYDCLRANKATMAWGVEARVPFLDREFLEYAMNVEPQVKMCNADRMEKFVLREAFDHPTEPYLPHEVLWRQKEQFSDGVGYGWIDALKQEAERRVSDLQLKFAAEQFPYSSPHTKEAYMYREIFCHHFPAATVAKTVPVGGKSIACSTEKALEWDEAFRTTTDPSGRAVRGIHKDAI